MAKLRKEIWYPVSYAPEHYEFSNRNRVRRIKGGPGCRAGRILKAMPLDGYLYVCLSVNAVPRTVGVHQLAAEYFHGPCPSGKEVNHKDGIKAHNTENNLEYITHIENVEHAVRNGLSNRGLRNGSNAKLTPKHVRRLRYLYGTGGHTYKTLGRMFGISSVTAGLAIRGKSWVDV